MQIEDEKHGNRDTGLNMVCTQQRLLWCAHVHVRLPIKVWFCYLAILDVRITVRVAFKYL